MRPAMTYAVSLRVEHGPQTTCLHPDAAASHCTWTCCPHFFLQIFFLVFFCCCLPLWIIRSSCVNCCHFHMLPDGAVFRLGFCHPVILTLPLTHTFLTLLLVNFSMLMIGKARWTQALALLVLVAFVSCVLIQCHCNCSYQIQRRL